MISETEQDILLHANSLYFQKKTAILAPASMHNSNNVNSTEHTTGLAEVYHQQQRHLMSKAIHITSNIWPRHRSGKEMRKKASRSMLHGVEIRTLDTSHFLSGETGLFASNPFCQFDIVGEYCGVVTGDMNNGGEYAAHLLMTMALNAQDYGNETRAINHYQNIAKGPNVIMKICHVDGLPRIMIVCKADIAVGEEFLLNYGDEYVQHYLSGFDAKADSIINNQQVDWSELSSGGGGNNSE
jgi:SET domain